MKNFLRLMLVLMVLAMPASQVFAQTESSHGPVANTPATGQVDHNTAVDGDKTPAHAPADASNGHESDNAAAHEPRGLLDFRLGDAVWNTVLFVLLAIVLGKFIWPQILKGLQDREEKIRGDITSAEQANKDAQETLTKYQQQLDDAHVQARKLIEQAKADAEQLRNKLASETEQQITQLRNKATDQIRLARQQTVQELYAQAAGLTTEIAAKVLQRQINEEDAKRLVEQSLAELDKI